jgi:hypothetical protein
MALAQAQLLSIYPGRNTPDENPWLSFNAQSYWIEMKVRLEFGVGQTFHEFRTFDTGVIVNSSTGDAQTLSVTLPATDEFHQLVESSLQDGLVWQVTIVQFESLSKQSLPILNYTVNDDRQIYDGGDLLDPNEFQILARFYGEVVNASSDTMSLSLELGPSLSPTGSQVPPRKFRSALVGAPLRL